MEPVISAVVILAAATVVLKKLVDLVRRVVPLEGPMVVLAAVVLGTLIAWFFDFQITELLIAEAGLPVGRDLPVILDHVVAGIAMAGFAGYIADVQKANAADSVADMTGTSSTRVT